MLPLDLQLVSTLGDSQRDAREMQDRKIERKMLEIKRGARERERYVVLLIPLISQASSIYDLKTSSISVKMFTYTDY